jgi:hypothetical protein
MVLVQSEIEVWLGSGLLEGIWSKQKNGFFLGGRGLASHPRCMGKARMGLEAEVLVRVA